LMPASLVPWPAPFGTQLARSTPGATATGRTACSTRSLPGGERVQGRVDELEVTGQGLLRPAGALVHEYLLVAGLDGVEDPVGHVVGSVLGQVEARREPGVDRAGVDA